MHKPPAQKNEGIVFANALFSVEAILTLIFFKPVKLFFHNIRLFFF